MKFIDDVKIWVKSGNGGNGCVSFRREKYVPRGGPDGGDGGRGGDIIFEANANLNTLFDYLYHPHNKAGNGGHGQGKGKTGRAGKDYVISVPVGTLIKDIETGEILHDLSEPGQRVTFLKGGRGGKGNARFATSTRRAPRIAEDGEEGVERRVRLELKLLADVGLVGLPNAGKSTLLSKLTAARPKVADYPFTTLSPMLGVVSIGDGETITLADIPGLIKDAHKGSGLGIRFLKHIERTRGLVHLIDIAQVGEDRLEPLRVIREELKQYSPELAEKDCLVVLNKIDLLESPDHAESIAAEYRKAGYHVVTISALKGENLDPLVRELARLLPKKPEGESSSPVLESAL